MATEMYRITRSRKTIGTIRKSDLTNHDDLLIRARYELAAMVDGNMKASVLRGHVTQYSDGSLSIKPRNAKGYSTDAQGNLITYWFMPYVFEPSAA